MGSWIRDLFNRFNSNPSAYPQKTPIKLTKKEIPKEEPPKKIEKTPVEIAREDKTPRKFTIIWDRNTYHTTAISKEQALGHIAARVSKGSTKPVGVLRKEMDGCLVKDEKWNLKY